MGKFMDEKGVLVLTLDVLRVYMLLFADETVLIADSVKKLWKLLNSLRNFY